MLRFCPPLKVVATAVFLCAALTLCVDYLWSGRANYPTKRTNFREIERLLAPEKETSSVWCLPLPSNLSNQSVEDVEKFVFFIGYPRSGHSIVASLVDAHPDAILAHEFNIFTKLSAEISTGRSCLLNKYNLFNALYRDSYEEATRGWRSGSGNYDKKGYSLKLNSSESWQGRYRRLKVIGDKSGGKTARMFRDEPELFQKMYRSLSNSVGVPIRVIHVVRNPFDMIATRLLYRLSGERRKKAEFNSTNKLRNEKVIRQAFNGLYGEANAVYNMIKACNLTVLEIHNVDFIRDTRKQMTAVCKFLGLNCSENYLNMCSKMAYSHTSRTRDSLEWSESMKNAVVTTFLLGFPFFERYSFETDQ